MIFSHARWQRGDLFFRGLYTCTPDQTFRPGFENRHHLRRRRDYTMSGDTQAGDYEKEEFLTVNYLKGTGAIERDFVGMPPI